MKIAILFDNFGPYHVARLNAASETYTVLGIEIHAQSREYGWEPDVGPRSFQSVTLSSPFSETPSMLLNQVSRLEEALDAFRPECVFVPGWSARYALASLWWCRTNRIPAVMMSESTQHDAARTRTKESVKSMILAMCSAAFVGGAAHADYLIKLGMLADRIFQGYDAVDNEFFHQKAAVVRTRAAEIAIHLNLPRRYFLAVARFIPRKNLIWLIEAYAKYREAVQGAFSAIGGCSDLEPWSLIMLGEGRDRPRLEQRIVELRLQDHVRLPGCMKYEDLPAYYALAGALVHPSRSEPWGLVVNEAMAVGLPVLVSKACGCARDLVRDGENGFRFDSTDSGQVVELMVRLSTQPDKTARMGTAAFEVVSDWGLDRFACGLRAAAEKAVAVGPQRGRFWQGLLVQLLSCDWLPTG